MPSRRLPLAVVICLLLALVVGSWWLFVRLGSTPSEGPTDSGVLGPPPDDRRPNIILVTLDTVRADRLSSYGASRPDTPHIDALAAEGVLFLDAATTVPFTLPAHSSMMTGVYPPRHGVRENVGYVLDERLPTLAEHLRDAGWDTAAFVSSFVLDSRWGIARGFDTYFDDFELEEDKPANLGSVQRDGAETVRRAIEWLDRAPERVEARSPDEVDALSGREPFFLWLHLFDAHDPYEPPEPFASRYPLHPYEAEVAYVDS
ncbi:MAG: sulfatase, partial [Thermoanaerobaculia bacterium]|nr:sulfatase [Thermoanaerobaculia bacterium]